MFRLVGGWAAVGRPGRLQFSDGGRQRGRVSVRGHTRRAHERAGGDPRVRAAAGMRTAVYEYVPVHVAEGGVTQ